MRALSPEECIDLIGLLKSGEENWSRRDRHHYREIMAKVDRDELSRAQYRFKPGKSGNPKGRIELMMSLGSAALKGDVGAAAMLLKMRAHCEKRGDINPTTVRLSKEDMRVL